MSKKDEENIERFFRKAAGQFDADTGYRDEDWRKMEKLLDDESARNAAIRNKRWKIGGVGAGAVMLALLWYFFNSNQSTLVTDKSVPVTSNESTVVAEGTKSEEAKSVRNDTHHDQGDDASGNNATDTADGSAADDRAANNHSKSGGTEDATTSGDGHRQDTNSFEASSKGNDQEGGSVSSNESNLKNTGIADRNASRKRDRTDVGDKKSETENSQAAVAENVLQKNRAVTQNDLSEEKNSAGSNQLSQAKKRSQQEGGEIIPAQVLEKTKNGDDSDALTEVAQRHRAESNPENSLEEKQQRGNASKGAEIITENKKTQGTEKEGLETGNVNQDAYLEKDDRMASNKIPVLNKANGEKSDNTKEIAEHRSSADDGKEKSIEAGAMSNSAQDNANRDIAGKGDTVVDHQKTDDKINISIGAPLRNGAGVEDEEKKSIAKNRNSSVRDKGNIASPENTGVASDSLEKKEATNSKEKDQVGRQPGDFSSILHDKNRPTSMWSFALLAAPDFSTAGLGGYTKPGLTYGFRVQYQPIKRISIITGMFRSNKIYVGDGADYHAPPNFWKNRANDMMPSKVDGSCMVLEFPLSVRYNLMEVEKNLLYMSAGISSYLMDNQNYNFTYPTENPGAVRNWNSKKRIDYYFDIGNFSFGYERLIKPHWYVGIEPYLKVPLKGLGWPKIDLFTTGINATLRYRIIRNTGSDLSGKETNQ